MDPGFYEDLAGRLYGLLIGLEGRLNCDDASIIHQFNDARHYGLALEEIARALAHQMTGITGQERARHAGPGRPGRPAGPRRADAAEGRSRAGRRQGSAGSGMTPVTRRGPAARRPPGP